MMEELAMKRLWLLAATQNCSIPFIVLGRGDLDVA